MTRYQYTCPRCGRFDLAHPMGTAPQWERCPACGSEARRAYSAPLINRTRRPLAEALARAEKSRDEPEVVTRIPQQ